MTTITNKEQFGQMLADEQAVLFIYFDWSGQAVVSLRFFSPSLHAKLSIGALAPRARESVAAD